MSHCMEAKKYIRNIASKDEFKSLLDNVILSNEERLVLEMVFGSKKTILDASMELNIARSTCRRYASNGLTQIYKFLTKIGEI